MLFQSTDLQKKHYTDIKFVHLMQQLIDDGIILEHKKEIIFLKKMFRAKYSSKYLLNRVEAHLNGITAGPDGQLRFDPHAASVVNPTLSYGKKDGVRGRIFDRNDQLLAGPNLDSKKRTYFLGSAAFHPVGYGGGVYFKNGIEGALNDYMRPDGKRPWWRYFWRGSGPTGSDIYLTLDASIQKKSYEALAGRAGAVVVIDPENGDILAMVSSPTFDPNTSPGSKWITAHQSESNPFLNRAIEELYPPGSLFKMVVAAAGLENNMSPVMTCLQKNQKLGISDRRAFGSVGYKNALAQSSNVYFARLGVLLNDRVAKQAKEFGFMTGLDLIPGNIDGKMNVIPSTAFMWQDPEHPEIKRPFSETDYSRNPRLVAQGAIGQNIVMATPLQMAMVVSTIANKGILMHPRLVLKAGELNSSPGILKQSMNENTAQKLTGAMIEMMNTGTGQKLKRLYISDSNGYSLEKHEGSIPIPVAGKTGTAEVKGKKSHAWFVCFAPAKKPKVAVCVLVENGGWGSSVAGPVGMEVLTTALNAKIYPKGL